MSQNAHTFLVLNASAGSGKTFTLVKEYLKILLLSKKPDAYKNILAITFTNKAVHEMKSRVVNNLSEFASEKPSIRAMDMMKKIQEETGLSLEEIHSKSKSIIKHLIHNYASFDISTIDKFTHRVIRSFAHDLNLPLSFEVTLDTENLLMEAVDSIISEAGADDEITDLLINYTLEKTNEDKSWDISREILNVGKLILNENHRKEISLLGDLSLKEFVAIKSQLLEKKEKILEETVFQVEKIYALIEKNNIDFNSFSGGHFPNHLKKIQAKEFNPKLKTYREVDDIKILKNAKDRDIIEQITPDLLQITSSIYTLYEKYFFYEAFLKNITPLSLLNSLNSKLKSIQKDQNVLSIAEFNQLIFEQIQNQPAPFIYERLGEKYRHFFIDEFQDTSIMQWENLIPLIGNSLSGQDDEGKKGSLLIVGDPKQSIYRWRGGKAEQFIDISNSVNPFPNVDKFVDSLDTNFRSYSEVIEFNNEFFKFIADSFLNEDYKELYQKKSHQNTNDKKGGFVSISFIPEKKNLENIDDDFEENDEEENGNNTIKDLYYLEKTYEILENARTQGFKYKDVAILTRKNDKAILLANYLTQRSIPILSSESLLLSSSNEVKSIVNLLHYLNNESDFDAKANFLYYLGNKLKSVTQVHDFIAKGMEQTNEEFFEKWLASHNIYFSFKDIRKKSLFEATQIIITKLIPQSKRTAYVQFFQDIVFEQDLKKQVGISDFLVYWEANSHKLSIPSPEGIDAVKIMTIHKSKGLEFPVVIFPFADQDYSRSPSEKLWLKAEESMGLPKALVNKYSSVKNFGENATIEYNIKVQEDLLDNINVLYVALTRAEEQLFVVSQMQVLNKQGKYPNNMASYFINYLIQKGEFDEQKLEYSFGENKKLSSHDDKTSLVENIPEITETLNPKNIRIAKKESLMWNTTQQEAIEYGNILHEILSFINTKEDLDLALTKAIENGIISFSLKDEIHKRLVEILNHQDLSIFYSENLKVLNEKTIIQKSGSIVKPDRMVIRENNEVLLLDYKTGQSSPQHQKQINNYQAAIEEMGFRVTKKTLVYIGDEIEIVNL